MNWKGFGRNRWWINPGSLRAFVWRAEENTKNI
jgi:hypothetical protein